jgi:Fe-S cluster assembly protein SufD
MVSQLTNTESKYGLAFRDRQSTERNSRAAWFERLRDGAMDHFEQVGLPSVDEEDWKYTNLAPIAKIDFDPVVTSDSVSLKAEDLEPFSYPEAEDSKVVLLNGIFHRELSELRGVSDIVVLGLADAVEHEKYSHTVREYLARGADYSSNGLIALNTAFLDSGAFILIPKNVKLESPLHVLCLSDPEGPEMATLPRILVVCEENSSATIIESYASTQERQYFTNAVVEVFLQDGARLEHYRVQRDSAKAFHAGTTAAHLGRASSYNTTSITLGGQLSRHDVNVIMDNEGAECRVDGLYIVSSGQHADTHSVIDHKQPHCTSHQLYKGILHGNSRAVFNGKIFVRHGAQKTDAIQTNKNLLLSAEARVDTKPQLEIFADDVKCAHGAAVGQIDEEELFYLETRGIHAELGRNLLTYGFAAEVIQKIAIDSIRSQLDEAVLNRLNARLEA